MKEFDFFSSIPIIGDKEYRTEKILRYFGIIWRGFYWRLYDFIYFLLLLSPFVYEGSISIRLKKGNGESVKKRFSSSV